MSNHYCFLIISFSKIQRINMIPGISEFYIDNYKLLEKEYLRAIPGVIERVQKSRFGLKKEHFYDPIPLIGEWQPGNTVLDLISGKSYPIYDALFEGEKDFFYLSMDQEATREEIVSVLSLISEEDIIRYNEKIEKIKNLGLQFYNKQIEEELRKKLKEEELEAEIQIYKRKLLKK